MVSSLIMSKKNDVTVQGTNDSSILSKHSMCHCGYMTDKFLGCFTLKHAPRRSPLINRGYYIRMKAIETLLTSFLQTPGKKQVVSLGAGFDTLYFRLRERYGSLKHIHTYVVEIDFPELVQRKNKLIQADTNACQFLDDDIAKNNPVRCDTVCPIDTPQYCLYGADLSDTDGLVHKLQTDTRLDINIPTLVLSECVMTYMDHVKSTSLIKCVQTLFTHCLFVTYEQIKPYDAFGRFMRGHFDKLNSSLRAICAYPTKDDHVARYQQCGFNKVAVFTMLEFYQSLPDSELQRVNQLEYFDEYEEWHQKCAHYIMVTARNSDCFTSMERELPFMNDTQKDMIPTEVNTIDYVSSMNANTVQFAHCSALLPCAVADCRGLNSYWLVICGGFGSANGKHGRIQDIKVYTITCNGDIKHAQTIPAGKLLTPRLHSTASPLDNQKIFVYGGRQSPSKPIADPAVVSVVTADMQGVTMTRNEDVASPECNDAARWRHAAVSFTRKCKEYVLISGGLTAAESLSNHQSHALSTCLLYNATDNQWTTAMKGLQLPVYSHAMCYDGKQYVYCLGGLTHFEKLVDQCYRMDVTASDDPRDWTWQKFDVPFEAAYSHRLVTVSETTILSVGGINSSGQQLGLQIIHVRQPFDTAYHQLPVSVNDDLYMYFNHTCHLIASPFGKPPLLLVVGGGGNCFSFGTHINKGLLAIGLPGVVQ